MTDTLFCGDASEFTKANDRERFIKKRQLKREKETDGQRQDIERDDQNAQNKKVKKKTSHSTCTTPPSLSGEPAVQTIFDNQRMN